MEMEKLPTVEIRFLSVGSIKMYKMELLIGNNELSMIEIDANIFVCKIIMIESYVFNYYEKRYFSSYFILVQNIEWSKNY